MAKKKAYADMTLAELHEVATKKDIPGRSDMDKAGLIAALEAADAGTPDAAAPLGAEEDAGLTLTAPAEVFCHEDFDLHWAGDGVTEVIISGHGKTTKSPVRIHAAQQGTMIIGASATNEDGKAVGATVTVNVVKKPT